MHLVLNERYVIYGHRGTNSQQINRDVCSFSFNVHGQEQLLKALLQEESGGPEALVGSVKRKSKQYDVTGEGIPGVKVIAEGTSGVLDTMTDANGQFAFSNIPPGSYHVHIESRDLLQDEFEWPRGPQEVPIGGCSEKHLYAWADGRVSGTVYDQNRKPIPGIPVQAFAFNDKNELETQSLREAITDQEGRYTLRGLPGGQFVIGVNGDKYEDKLPYPPTFYPKAREREHAQPLLLAELEQKSDINLSLAPAREQTVITIDVKDEDGNPVVVGSASIEDETGVQRFFFMQPDKEKSGMFKVTVYRGENYILNLSKFTTSMRPDGKTCCSTRQWTGKETLSTLNAPEVHVTVILREIPMPTGGNR
jgi:protocatechuate 3,4-dioxygenase beta subunit